MRLTIVRDVLEDREIENLLPLRDLGFDLQLVSTRTAGQYGSTGLGLPLDRRWTSSDIFGPRPIARWMRRALHHVRDPDVVFGLRHAVADSDWVSVMELHAPSTAQICRMKHGGAVKRVVVIAYENIPFRYEGDDLLAARRELVRETADLFVARTPAAHDALVSEGVSIDRIAIQPNGVDPSRFDPANRDEALRSSWGVGAGELAVVYAGRLLREKGLVELIRAAARVDVRFKLVLIGSGPEEPRMRRAITQLGIQDLVTFVPWLERDEMPTVMASADVFAMPSLPTPYWEEQLGYSLIEAMASGAAILSTRGASIPFVVGSGAVLVPPYDIDALANGLRQLLCNPQLRESLGRLGRLRVEQSLNVKAVAESWSALLSQAQ
jgi:glycosyltransferase involved in cell wall biosynthesis